jgi:hypothetical protein
MKNILDSNKEEGGDLMSAIFNAIAIGFILGTIASFAYRYL